nr:MAG TPA: hypothetical protein [Siphoviridae sp. ctQHO9]
MSDFRNVRTFHYLYSEFRAFRHVKIIILCTATKKQFLEL